MKRSNETLGVISALLERLEKQRLPRLRRLQARVNQGEVLEKADLQFLETVSFDTQRLVPLVDENPEFQDLFIKLVSLYEEITTRALQNEQ